MSTSAAPTLLSAKARKTFRDALLEIAGTDLVIASAFGRSESELLGQLVRQNRSTRFYVGTQNCFTSADFITKGCELASNRRLNLDFVVDFRRDDSLHWKVALAAPDTVVIGSANFTGQGLGLRQDLMAAVKDRGLYESILAEFDALHHEPGVIRASSRAAFEAALKDYTAAATKEASQERQEGTAARRKNPFAKAPVRVPSLAEWLQTDAAKPLHYFEYDCGLDPSEKQAAAQVKRNASLKGIEVAPLDEYAPGTRPFPTGTQFLDINMIDGAYRAGSAIVVHSGRGKGRGKTPGDWIMLGRPLPRRDAGFRVSNKEAAKLASYVTGPEGRKLKGNLLTVSAMREALT